MNRRFCVYSFLQFLLLFYELLTLSSSKTEMNMCLFNTCPHLQHCLDSCRRKRPKAECPGKTGDNSKDHPVAEPVQQELLLREDTVKLANNYTMVGDMVLSAKQLSTLKNLTTSQIPVGRSQHQRSGVSRKTFFWPKGIIPVKIDPKMSAKMRRKLINAMRDMNYLLRGCILFRKATESDKRPLRARESNQCSCTVGFHRGSGSDLNLYEGCAGTHHELIHCIGFMHEFQRPDRDKYLKIQWQKLGKNAQDTYKIQNGYGETYGTRLNFYSAMMYSVGNNQERITTTNKSIHLDAVQATSLPARSDLMRIRRMYKCEEPELPIKCPWEKFQDVCLRIGQSRNAVTWSEAVKACQKMAKGSRLYEPRDYTSYIPLFEHLKKNRLEMIQYWIGAKRSKKNLRGTYASNKLGMAFPDCFNSNRVKFRCNSRNLTQTQCYAIEPSEKNVTKSLMGYECSKKLAFICEIHEDLTKETREGSGTSESREIQGSTDTDKSRKKRIQEREQKGGSNPLGQDIPNRGGEGSGNREGSN